MMLTPEQLAELESAIGSALGGPYYMDPPDGGSVTLEEQLQRMAKDAARYRWLRSNLGKTVSHWFCTEGGGTLDEEIDAATQK